MAYLWHELRLALPLIVHGDRAVAHITWVTIRLALIATVLATLVGLPLALVLGLERFRGRRALIVLADATLALPPVVVGVAVLVLTLPNGPFGSLRIEFTVWDVTLAQAILALPFVVALATAALQALPEGLLAQARALGAGRLAIARLALAEARVGVTAAVIAALGTALSEIAAVIIVGGNIEGYDQTLGSAILQQIDDFANYPLALALGIVLMAVVLALAALLTFVQQSRGGLRLRFRPAG